MRIVLSHLLLPILRERFPNRGLIEGLPPDPCAVFLGLHPGIERVAIFDDGEEFTVSIDDLTHSHFSEYLPSLSKLEQGQATVVLVVEFLDGLFADRIAVWGRHDSGGGWCTLESATRMDASDVSDFAWTNCPIFVWSGPLE